MVPHMGFLEGAANGLMMRLTSVGVPEHIAFMIGQVAYLREGKYPPFVPPAVIPRSEVTWLVDTCIKELKQISDPLAHMAVVQGLCRRIFASRSEEVFVAGYPEWSAEAYEQRLRAAAEAESRAEIKAEALVQGATRFFNFDPSSEIENFAILKCTLVTAGGSPAERRWDGFVMTLGSEIGFLDEDDAFAADVKDGTPRINVLSDLLSCRIRTPEWVSIPKNLRYVGSGSVSENVLINLKFRDDEWVLAIWIDDLIQEDSLDSALGAFTHFVRICELVMSDADQQS